jgi:hypothetical protein
LLFIYILPKVSNALFEKNIANRIDDSIDIITISKYFQNYQTRFENGLRNRSKTDPKQFWSILNRIDRSSEKEKISIDNLYEYFKDLNNYNDIDDESEFDITYDNDFINSSIDGNAVFISFRFSLFLTKLYLLLAL